MGCRAGRCGDGVCAVMTIYEQWLWEVQTPTIIARFLWLWELGAPYTGVRFADEKCYLADAAGRRFGVSRVGTRRVISTQVSAQGIGKRS